MKKILFSAAIAVLGFTSMNAQDDQTFGFAEGDIIVEGNVNFYSSKDKNTDTKNNSVTISPKVGFFLNDDLAIGANLSVGSSKTEVSGTDTSKFSQYGVGVFGRYYFLDIGQRFKTYTELGVGYMSNNNKLADVKTNSINAGLDLGVNYFVKENIALTFGLDNLLSFSSSKIDVS